MHNNIKKKILLINSSSEKINPLNNIFEELQKQNYCFDYLFSKNKLNLGYLYLGINLKNKINFLFFLFLWPFFLLYYFFVLLYKKFKKNIDIIICVNWNEKIIFTFLAKLLNIKTIWLELPDNDYENKPKFLILLFKIFSNWAKIIVFFQASFDKLKKIKIKEDKIKLIFIGIKTYQIKKQDNIFSKIANNKKEANLIKKYFTIGTVTDFHDIEYLESLLHAIKICTNVIPNLQLIVVGENEEKRKKLNWLATKLEINNLTWFVGYQKHLKKWLDSFSIFISTVKTPRLMNLKLILYAMSTGLPIINTKKDIYFNNLEVEEFGLFIDFDKESLAQGIIKLYKNKELATKLGNNANKIANQYFNFEKMIEDIKKLLK